MNDRHRFALPAMSWTISALPGALQRCGALPRGQASGPNTLLRAHLLSDDLMWRPLPRCSGSCRRQRTERRNSGQDFLEQTARHHDPSHLEGDGSAMASDLCADHPACLSVNRAGRHRIELLPIRESTRRVGVFGRLRRSQRNQPPLVAWFLSHAQVRMLVVPAQVGYVIVANWPDAVIRPGAPI